MIPNHSRQFPTTWPRHESFFIPSGINYETPAAAMPRDGAIIFSDLIGKLNAV